MASNTISLDDMIPGMTLARPVINRFGQTMLQSGVILDERYIRLLRTWGIPSVEIITVDSSAAAATDASKLHESLMPRAAAILSKCVQWQPGISIEEDLLNAAQLAIVHAIMDNEPVRQSSR
jgi:hypothetical protein